MQKRINRFQEVMITFDVDPSKIRIESARSSKSLHTAMKRNKEKEQFQENKRLKEKIENVQSSLAYRKIIENYNQ